MSYKIEASDRDTMRQMTREEIETYYARERCPFCDTPTLDFVRGPRGGLSVNVECYRCRCRLNVISGIPRGVVWLPFGQVIRDPLSPEDWDRPGERA